jgi:hydrogenase maturation protease
LTRKALVVGYGNPLRGDDAVGQVVAQALAATTGIEAISCHQLLPELAERLAGVELVVFVDAAVDLPAGEVRTMRVEAEPTTTLGHHATPATLLALATQVYGQAPEAFLVSVGAASLEIGETLSGPVASAVPKAIAAVQIVLTPRHCERSEAIQNEIASLRSQ